MSLLIKLCLLPSVVSSVDCGQATRTQHFCCTLLEAGLKMMMYHWQYEWSSTLRYSRTKCWTLTARWWPSSLLQWCTQALQRSVFFCTLPSSLEHLLVLLSSDSHTFIGKLDYSLIIHYYSLIAHLVKQFNILRIFVLGLICSGFDWKAI